MSLMGHTISFLHGRCLMKQSNKGQTIILASLWNRSCINLDNIGQILYTLRSCTCCCRSLRFFQRQRRDWWWPTLGQKWRESGRAARPFWVQQFSMSLMGHPISFLHGRCSLKSTNTQKNKQSNISDTYGTKIHPFACFLAALSDWVAQIGQTVRCCKFLPSVWYNSLKIS